jgi:hypothetical protein
MRALFWTICPLKSRKSKEKKTIQGKETDKEQKKAVKGFPDMLFDANDACVLPEAAADIVFNFIFNMKTIDVMKLAIMKIYNPLAGKAPRSSQI